MKRVFLSVFTVLLFISCQKETYQDSKPYAATTEDFVFDILGLESKEFSSKIKFIYLTQQQKNITDYNEGRFYTSISLKNHLVDKDVKINDAFYSGINEDFSVLSEENNKEEHVGKLKTISLLDENSCLIVENFRTPSPIILKNNFKEYSIEEDLVLEFEYDENYNNPFVIHLLLNGDRLLEDKIIPSIRLYIEANTKTYKVSSEELKSTFFADERLTIYLQSANFAENECEEENVGVFGYTWSIAELDLK